MAKKHGAAALLCAALITASGCTSRAPDDNANTSSVPAVQVAPETTAPPTTTEALTETSAKTTTVTTITSAVTTKAAEPAPEADKFMKKAQKITAGMTFSEKIGQMIAISAESWQETDGEPHDMNTLPEELSSFITEHNIGGFILYRQNCAGTENTVRLIHDLQNAAYSSSSAIPMFICTDQEGGDITRVPTVTATCGNMAVAATGNPKAAAVNASIIGSELATLGINTDLAPVLDLNSDPSNPILNLRSFSSDPAVSAEMGVSFIGAIQKHGICTAVKHFPGHGDTGVDNASGLPVTDRTYYTLSNEELIPFSAAVEAGTDMVIVSHIQCPQIEADTCTSKKSGEDIYLPASLSDDMMDILRTDMAFDGIIMTDSMDTEPMTANFDTHEMLVLAINAGADIISEPVHIGCTEDLEVLAEQLELVEKAVKSGEIEADKIDAAVSRIIALKLRKNIISERAEDEDENAVLKEKINNALENVGCEDHHEKELGVAKLAVTMVKNEKNALPIKLSEEQQVIYFHPYESGANAMNYTVDMLKRNGIIPENANVIVHCFTEGSASESEEEIAASEAVIIGSEVYRREYMDKNDEMGWQARFIDEAIGIAHKNGKKAILLSMELPYDCARYTAADAILVGYGAMDMAEIPTRFNGETLSWGPNYVAALLTVFGANKPHGKLPVDIHTIDKDNRYTDEIMYHSGYGLEY